MFRLICTTLSIVAVVCPGSAATLGDALFPISKGTYWIYRGEVTWEDNKEKKSTPVELKMEVVERISRPDGVAAVLKGYPAELTRYSPGRERHDYLLIRLGETKFYLVTGSALPGALESIQNPDQRLSELVDESQLMLQFPLKAGAVFGEPDQLKRGDNMYVWWVELESLVRLTHIQGVPSGKQREYSMAFRTHPDHTYITFVPGVGITSYLYGHHGTASEVSVHLVKVHLQHK